MKGFYIHKEKIYDENDNPVVLKGVSKTGLEYAYADLAAVIPEMVDFDVQKLSEWGVNVVRIPIRDYFWLTQEEYRQKVDLFVDKMVAKNWVVILDLHTQQKNPNMDNFILRSDNDVDGKKMWADISQHYSNQTRVFFEIFNEPNHITPEIWWDGNLRYFGYKEILKEIRKNANNICILGGLDYAYQWAFLKKHPKIYRELASFQNIALATHPYGYRGKPDEDGTGSIQIPTSIVNVNGDNTYTGDCSLGVSVPTIPYEQYGWNESFGYLMEEQLFPVIATEWGLDHPDNCIQGGWFNRDILSYMNSLNMSYTAWAWVQDRLDYPSLLGSEFQPTGRATRETFGPACSGALNSFYPGPGELVRRDLMPNTTTSARELRLFHHLVGQETDTDKTLFVRNFVLLFCCLFAFFNVFFWVPVIFRQHPTRKPPQQASETVSTATQKIRHSNSTFSIRIRSSHSLAQIANGIANNNNRQ